LSRLDKATKNIKYGYIEKILTLILGFISRTVFIYTLGATYLGINGLFTNILSILSFAELGIGVAMNFSLYKPVADNDLEKIKALMNLYKHAYRYVAFIIAGIGLVLTPFLKYIIKDPGSISINEITIYYLIYLFNTVSTYFVVYKYSLINAEQKNYIQSNIQVITTMVTTAFQIIVLLVFKNFLLYLLTASVIQLVQKIFINVYLNKMYPFLLDKNVKKLSKEESAPIKQNIKALIFHKIGDMSVHQTDNILISAFINITTVGLVSNYLLIITSIDGFISIIFNSIISSFGNLIATEDLEKQYKYFKIYRFIGFWVYGFATIAFIILLNPFIELWIGSKMVIANIVVYLIIVDYYFKGERIIVNNFKTAAGVFDPDKYISIIQAIVNLVLSIVLVKLIGLPGIYIGTIVQGLISNFSRPFIVYKEIFHKSAKEYYKDSILYIAILMIPLTILAVMKIFILSEVTLLNFIILTLLVTIIPNLFFFLFFKNREEFRYLLDLFKKRTAKI